MAGPVTFKVSGLRELDAALGEFTKATAKNVLIRVGKKALIPMADAAEALLPTLTGHMRDSITEGNKLTSRQSRLAKRDPDKDFATVSMGPNDAGAVAREFGTFDQPPRPFMRPAFQSEAENTIHRVADGLKPEIDKAAARVRARALKAVS